MLPPNVKQLEGSGSLNDSGGSCTTSSKAPKKSVRFTTEVAYDDSLAQRSAEPAAWAAAGSGADSGELAAMHAIHACQ